MFSKVNGIVKAIYENRIEEFYFKFSVPDGYRLKTTEPSSIDGTYLTEAEVDELLTKLHIRTETIVHKVFKLDLEKEAYFKRILSSIHDLGMLKQELTASTITKEELISEVNLLKALTKDNDLASLDVDSNLSYNQNLDSIDDYTLATTLLFTIDLFIVFKFNLINILYIYLKKLNIFE